MEYEVKYSSSLKDLMNRLNKAQKYAQENGDPKDPDEQSIPEIPEDKKPEGEADTQPSKLDSGSTKAGEPPADKPAEGGSGCEEMEKEFSLKAAAILEKVKNLKIASLSLDKSCSNENGSSNVKEKQQESNVSIKKDVKNDDNANKKDEQNDDNANKKEDDPKKASLNKTLVDNIDINEQLLSKVARAMLDTEDGRRAIQDVIESEQGKQLQLATMQELKLAAEKINNAEIDNFIKTATINNIIDNIKKLPKDQQEIAIKTANIHMKNLDDFKDNEILKRAYAAGAEAAEAMNNGQPLPESDIAENPVSQMMLIGQAIDELVATNQITEEQAQMIAGIIAEAAKQDNNTELSEEELANALQQLYQNGALPPEIIQQLSSMQSQDTPAVDNAVNQTDNSVINSDSSKTASDKGEMDDDSDLSEDDVEQALDSLIEEGSISVDDASTVVDAINNAINTTNDDKSLDETCDKKVDNMFDIDLDDVSEDDVEQALDSLIEEGSISAEDASAIVDAINSNVES